MSGDESTLTPREERTAAALRLALREASDQWPLRVNAAEWVASAPRRGAIVRRWLPIGMAAALLLVLAAGMALVLWPTVSPGVGVASPSAWASIPGTPGHFDNGAVSFDYPTDWRVIAGDDHGATGVLDVFAVLGTGSWQENCQHGSEGTMSWMNCGADVVDVPPGGVVVKVYRWWGGPAPVCRGDTQANATFGTLAVRKIVDGTTTSYEIRLPGNEFGQQSNNVFVEVHTSNPAELARAEALVASFRWIDTSVAGACGSLDLPTGDPGAS